jgi:hypothetical protein
MGEGDDRVVLRDLRVHGEVGIRMGAGEDQVIVGVPPVDPMPPDPASIDEAPPLRGVGIGGSLRIGLGEGNDRVHVGHAAIRGALHVDADGGDDMVVLGIPPMDPPVEPVSTNGETPPVDPVPFRAALRVGHGIHANLGEGNDGFVADLVGSAGGLHVNGGLGDDRIGVHASRIGRAMALLGGDGDGADQVVVNHVAAHLAAIGTGAGNDNVRIVDSLFFFLGVHLGEGNDTLAVEGNTAEAAVLLGGEGEDTLLGLRNNRFHRQFVRGFELPAMDGGGG